ncbi:cadherin domain protein [Oesophagostomum dentatum]|uniref:Cadherin domain protein n=1 Tax=Oesophagostomum dentatum TaxID=61180 RepID=A0A0B1TAX3_OESDE|nr:cadherin domain protein [Oesophagostomum dentatum]
MVNCGALRERCNKCERLRYTVNVFVEGDTTSTTSASEKAGDGSCYFPQQVYTAEVMENRSGRRRILKVTSSCEAEGRPYEYAFSYPISEFELDPKTGELFVTLPLDREDRSHHFLYIEVTNGSSTVGGRVTRGDPLIEKAKEHLNRTQTLVAIRVLDENDNAPAFPAWVRGRRFVDGNRRLAGPTVYSHNSTRGYLLQRSLCISPKNEEIQAKDPDERPQLSYSISGEGADYFRVNATSGLVILSKSLADFTGDSFQLTATVTDGLHIVPTPLRIYVISPSSSVVQLTSEVPHTKIDQRMIERTLNEINGLDNRLLVKQPYVDQQGHADPTRSHLFVYALDSKTKIPYLKEDLAKVLEHHAASLLSSPPKISEISLLSPPPTTLSAFDLALAILCALLLLFLLAACCFLTSYCKRKRAIATSDREYMVSSSAGPRPYDVEEVSRTTAQRVLSARPLPEPMTNQIEVAVSPIFMDDMVSTNKSDTTKDFSNSVRERPSLLQSALARQKIHAADINPTKSPQK